MKKIILCLVSIVLSLFALTSCTVNNYKPMSIKYENSDYVAYTDGESKTFLMELLNNSKWYNDVAKCGCDYTIIMKNDREIYYHSECGTFIDYDFNKSLTINEEDRVKLNDYFIDIICNSGVHFFDENQKCTACGYTMTIGGAFEFEYTGTEEGHCPHKVGETCDGTCIKSPHEDLNHDMLCDICNYKVETQVPTNYFLRNQLGCEWLNDINVDDITEIKIISETVGVAPGTPKNIQSSTDNTVIERIFEDYYWLDGWPISKEDGEIDGGGAVTVKFILRDGTVKEIYINNGNYCDSNNNYFELLNIPNFKATDNSTKSYGFVNYIGSATIYDSDNNPICEFPVDEIEYVITGYDFSLFDSGYDYYINTEFGKLYTVKIDINSSEGNSDEFDRTDYYFMTEHDKEFCYRIVGKNVDELIYQYSKNINE